jgi:hypothetical protein
MFGSWSRKSRKSKNAPSRAHRPQRFVPELQRLDDRIVPTRVSYNTSTDKLIVQSEHNNETIVIRHHGNGEVRVEDSHGLDLTFSDVSHLTIDTQGRFDNAVRYMLDGDLTRSMNIHAYFSGNNGGDSSRFTGTLNRDITGTDLNLTFKFFGGYSDDLFTLYGMESAPTIANDHLTDGLAINPGGLYIASGSTLSVTAQGGYNKDRVFFYYSGVLDGHIQFDLNGGNQSDQILVIAQLLDGSSGGITSSQVIAGSGNDGVWVKVYDYSDEDNGIYVHAYADNPGDWFSFDHDLGSFTSFVEHEGFDGAY